MSLTKADMAEMLFEELGLNKRESKEMVEKFFEEVKQEIRKEVRYTSSNIPKPKSIE